MHSQFALTAPRRPHPFRQSIMIRRLRRSSDDGDLRLFALSFTAFFVCFYTFLM